MAIKLIDHKVLRSGESYQSDHYVFSHPLLDTELRIVKHELPDGTLAGYIVQVKIENVIRYLDTFSTLTAARKACGFKVENVSQLPKSV